MAAGFGLLGGYLDLVSILVRREVFWRHYLQGREFYWTVPSAGFVLVMLVGLLVAVASRLRPGLISIGAAGWLLATVALWGALLRLPLHGVASLLLAAGLGRWASRAVVARIARRPWLGGSRWWLCRP
jgi:hypothetical protein